MTDTTVPLSEVAIANFAAHTLDERTLVSLDDNSKFGRFVQAEFGYIRDELLRSHPWGFATDYAVLAPNTDGPPFGWLYAYTIPTTWVRVFPLTECGMHGGRAVKYQRVGNKLYTNDGPVLHVRGIRRVVAPGEFDPLFARALGQYIALRGAENITGKSGYTAKAQKFFDDALQAAIHVDSLERGTTEDVENAHGTMDALSVRGT